MAATVVNDVRQLLATDLEQQLVPIFTQRGANLSLEYAEGLVVREGVTFQPASPHPAAEGGRVRMAGQRKEFVSQGDVMEALRKEAVGLLDQEGEATASKWTLFWVMDQVRRDTETRATISFLYKFVMMERSPLKYL